MKNKLSNTHLRIKPYIHNTPVLTSTQLNTLTNTNLYFKCENFQKMGAFKMRGATNAILQLSEKDRKKGVVTHSSGNFAQAVALAAKSLGVSATIVMPSNAPAVKIDAVKGYGGKVVLCPPTNEDRQKTADAIVSETGATFLHPSNDLEVILGQGTAALELIEEVKTPLDAIVIPVGGGGLAAGTILATQAFSPTTKVYGGEPATVDDAYRSIKSGKIEYNTQLNTIADGLKTHLGDINFPIIMHGIAEIILVSEEEIIEALKLLWSRLKIIVEPSCAVAFAAVLKDKKTFENKEVGIVLSGGNVDFKTVFPLF